MKHAVIPLHLTNKTRITKVTEHSDIVLCPAFYSSSCLLISMASGTDITGIPSMGLLCYMLWYQAQCPPPALHTHITLRKISSRVIKLW